MMRKDLLPIAKAMGPICPSVLEQLKSNWDDSLSAYIQQVWQKPISCSSTLALQARSCFYETLKLFLAKKSVDFKNLFLEFDRFPILQTGPHCQLYTNDVDFNAMLMSWMGSQVHQLKHCLILNSITRTLQWSKRQGPGWLTLKQDVVNVFNLSPKKMSRLSVCSLYPGLSYCFDNFNNYIAQADRYENRGLQKLVHAIPQTQYTGFVSAFTSSNNSLITLCDSNQEVQPLILNDHFTALLVAEHLRPGEGVLYELIFSPKRRHQFKQVLHSLQQNKYQVFLKQNTEYFWGLRDNKIRALKIEGDFLTEDTNNLNKQLKIPLNVQTIRAALIDGRLIPNIFVSFLVLSLMPQIRVLGGTRQIAYLPLIQKLFAALLNPAIAAERELLQELFTNDLNAWGTNFLRDKTSPLEWLGQLPAGQELSALSKHYLNKSIAEITQELTILKEHPVWKHMT